MRRRDVFTVRLDHGERELIKEAAEARGVTASEHAREALLDASRTWLAIKENRHTEAVAARWRDNDDA